MKPLDALLLRPLPRVLALSVAAALAGAGCSVVTVNIGTKTALERQLMGELEPLSEEELLVASVRAEAQATGGSLADLQAAAVAARRRQLFNRDDVDEAKQQGCLGEALGAELVARACEAARDASVAARHALLVEQENADRAAVVSWVLAADSALTATDRPEVLRVYHRVLVEAARAGEWIQEDEGTWKRR